jgi:hypothetical protein
MAKEDTVRNGLYASKLYQIFISSNYKSMTCIELSPYFGNKITHDIYYFRSTLVLLVRQAPPKDRGHVLNTKSGGQFGPRNRCSIVLVIAFTISTFISI